MADCGMKMCRRAYIAMICAVSDYDPPGQPVTVEKTVVVNHAASVLMAEDLTLARRGGWNWVRPKG